MLLKGVLFLNTSLYIVPIGQNTPLGIGFGNGGGKVGDFFHPPRVCLHLRHKSRHSIIDFKAKRPYSLTLGVKGGESGRPTKGSAGRQGSARDARSAVRVPRQRFGALMHSLLHAFEHDSFRRSGGNSAQGVARKT